MPYQMRIPVPPARPLIPGWFAIVKILAKQNFALSGSASSKGIVQALQTLTIGSAASVIATQGVQTAQQTFTMTNAATAALPGGSVLDSGSASTTGTSNIYDAGSASTTGTSNINDGGTA